MFKKLDTLVKIISKLKTKNSSGPDNISSKLLKVILPTISTPLCHLFNLSLQTGYDDVQDTRAKNAFNARVIRFFGKCYQLIINNQVDTQRLILTFTQ